MKILYVGSERSDAQAIATALRGLDQAVTVSWASHLEHATRWVDEHRDIAALVIDTQLDSTSSPSVLTRLHDLAWHPAVVVIVPPEADLPGPDPAALYIRRNQSLVRELPVVVTRAIERAARVNLEQQLARATAALHDAEQRHRTAVSAADRHMAELQSQYEISMARAAATWDMVDEQLRTAALEVERARQDQASAAADVDRLKRQLAESDAAVAAANARTDQERLTAAEQLAERQHEFQSKIAHEVDRRRNIEDLLAEAAVALDDAEKRYASEITDATAHTRELETTLRAARQDLEATAADVARLATREAELDSRLADTIDSRTDLERRLAATEAAFDDAVTRATRDRLDASKKAAEREAQVDRELTHTTADRDRLAQQLSDTVAALEHARHDYRAAAADIERLTEREAALGEQIQQGRAARATLEQAIVDAEAALRDARQRHDDALAAAATTRAERQAEFERELTQTTADRDRLAQQLGDTDSALEQSRRDHRAATTDIERLTAREAELTSRLTNVQAARKTVDRQLAKATKAIQEGAAREATLDEQLQQELATRDALEQAIEDAEAALRDGQEQHDAALAAAAAELALRQAGFDHLLSQRAADRDCLIQRLGEITADLDAVCVAYESSNADIERLTRREAELTSQLADAEAALIDAQQRHDAALAAAATQFAEHQARLDRELLVAADECDRLSEQVSDAGVSLEQARQDHEATVAEVEHLTRQGAELRSELAGVQTERNTLGQSLAETRARALEHEEQFNVRLAQERLDHESRLADVQARNRSLELERDALQQSLVAMQDQSQQLRDLLASSMTEFEASSAESHRLFDQAGLAMFRCTRDGGLIDANRACTTLVGRRTLDELQGARFPAGAFDAPNALFWLIERCLSTRMKETVEATWRRNDGGRLFVRVSARLSGSDVIEFVVEDLTRLRILEERLSQAHRMEAVGRLASEVAVTCSTLLTDIHQNGRDWLATTGADVDSRQRGERLLDDIKRAASLMQELAACGDEQQTRTPMLVDLNTLVRDLEPVLKRVAGGDVDVQLQDDSSPLNVDVGTERVERLLVNLASYGRGRMPFGGQLRIELGKSVVDRRFAAKHPNVRLGLHALITVTEIRRATGTDGSSQPLEKRPAVDFGTLQGLVSECGGHLWMKVQPPGEMVAKIHLPLSSPDQTLSRSPGTRGRRERLTARLFQT